MSIESGVEEPSIGQIEAHFAAAGRTPKGRKALREIFRATHHLLIRDRLCDVSLEAIAVHAGLSQAALRHYFPTREVLLSTFMVASSQWHRTQITRLLTECTLPPLDSLRNCLTWHLQYMEAIDTALWLENSIYWLHHGSSRRVRDDFYDWLTGQYAALIRKARPALDARTCRDRALLVRTLILGAWITHGRGSAGGSKTEVATRRQLLIETAMSIATR